MSSKLIAIGTILAIGAGIVGFFSFFFSFDVRSTRATSYVPNNNAIQATIDQTFLLPVSQPNYLPIRDFNVIEPVIDAKASGLYDIKSDRFLFKQNIDSELPIASITKLMTAVIVSERLKPDEVVTIKAQDINVDGHGAEFQKDEKILVRDLLKIMLIKSSNDAASSFATYAQTKDIDFVAVMNAKAQELNMHNTKFLDPSGLDDNAHSTVRDLVQLYSYINKTHKYIWEILRTKSDDVLSTSGLMHHVTTTNQLLGLIPNIIAGKTGYTDLALGTMSLMVAQDSNDALISIVLGSNDRFGETKKLIDWSQHGYRWQ